MELKHRVVSGFLWAATEKVGSLLVHLCATVMLLRLLDPGVYGLMSMLTVFTAISNSIVDSGFSQALIQKKQVSAGDYDSVFWLNLAIAAGLYLLMWGLAGPIASFYGEPELAGIAPWAFCALPLSALGLVQTTVLTREMNFRMLSKINFVASLCAAVAAVVMAYRGFGVWALVGQSLTLYTVRTGLLWIFGKWRPAARFSGESVRGLFGLGSRLFAVGMITQLFNNFSMMMIGRFYDAPTLGPYDRAMKLRNVTAEAVSLPVQNVTFPALSTMQDDNTKIRAAARQVVSMLSLALFPVMLGLAAVADEGFLIAGEDKWLAAIPYFKVLCLSALCLPLSNICLNLLKAKGQGGILLRTEIVKKAFGFAVILGGAMVSVMAVVWAFLAWSVFEMIVNVRFASKITGYRFREQLADTLPYLAMAAVMWAAAVGVGYAFEGYSPYVTLTLKVIAGAVVYAALGLAFRPRAWREAVAMVSTKLRRIFKGEAKQ